MRIHVSCHVAESCKHIDVFVHVFFSLFPLSFVSGSAEAAGGPIF